MNHLKNFKAQDLTDVMLGIIIGMVLCFVIIAISAVLVLTLFRT